MATLPQFIMYLLNQIPYYEKLSKFELWNNSGLEYALVPILFFIFFIIGYVLKFIVLSRLQGILPETGSDITEPTLDQMSSLISFFTIVLVSMYLSIQHLKTSANVAFTVNVIAVGYVMYILYKFSSGMIEVGADYKNKRTKDNQEHILSFIKLIGKIFVASIIFLWYLSILNINITGAIAGLGIAGITIAFALQNIAADLFSAVAIYMDRPFELGDYIKVNDKGGTVEKIGIRTTHIRSPDGPLIVMSNQNLTNNDITNFGKMRRRRIQQVIGVSADAPVSQLRELSAKIEKGLEELDMVTVDRIWLKELGSYTWNYELIYYIEDPSMDIYRERQDEINYRILEIMEQENIELPYPIREVRLKDGGKFMEQLGATIEKVGQQPNGS